MVRHVLLLCFFISIIVGQDPNCSTTIWGGPDGAGESCAFPFKLFGRTITSCTTLTEGDSRPWCATATATNGEYILGQKKWGYCDPRCAFINKEGILVPGTTPKPSLRKFKPTFPFKVVPRRLPITPTVPNATTTLAPPSLAEVNPDSRYGNWLPSPKNYECGFGTNVGYIVGGESAVRGEFPFAVLLGYRTKDPQTKHYKCGGVLINRRYVLTAAHCHLPGRDFEIHEVVIGEHDVGKDPDCWGCRPVARYRPEKVITHEGYGRNPDENGEHDIALVRLPEPVTTIREDSDSIVSPICLGFGMALESSKEFYTMGWGRSSNGLIRDTDIPTFGVSERLLSKLKVPLVDFDKCQARFPAISNKFVCAGGEEGKDSCNGDSGGPLIARQGSQDLMFLLGLVSRGTRRCGIGAPGLYMNVNEYQDWIMKNLEP